MNTLFVPYELAVKLKELGFNEQCMRFYSPKNSGLLVLPERIYSMHNTTNSSVEKQGYCSAPLWQQAFDWFREKHNLFVTIHAHPGGYSYNIQNLKGSYGMIEMLVSTILPSMNTGKYFETLEVTREKALENLVELKLKKVC